MEEFIEKAEIIRTQGRWVKLNEAITNFAEKCAQTQIWKIDVFPNIAFNLLNEYSHLRDSFYGDDRGSPIVVWHARNLLELSVWAAFCLRSETNERRFYEDSSVDMHDILLKTKNALSKDSSLFKDFESGIQRFKRESEIREIRGVDRKYLNIKKIAADLKLTDQFNYQNKFLSKFVHPTALQIVSPHIYEKVRQQAFGFGCMNFVNAFPLLESYFFNNDFV